VEETRQHPSLSGEQISLAAVYFGGLLAIVQGIVAQFTLGDRSLHVGLLGFLLSKIVISIWSIVRPASFPGKQSRPAVKALVAVAWTAFAVVLASPFLGNSS